jgi:hypothetical protein
MAIETLMRNYTSLHATILDNFLIRPDSHLTPYEMVHGKIPGWIWEDCSV